MTSSQEKATQAVSSLMDYTATIQHNWENPSTGGTVTTYTPLIAGIEGAQRCIDTIRQEIKKQLYDNIKGETGV